MRNKALYILMLFVALSYTACEDATSPNDSNGTSGKIAAPDTPSPSAPSTDRPLPTSHNCSSRARMMEDNQLFIPEARAWIVVVADSSTADPDFGDSYRILEVYNTDDCRLLHRETMAVNMSPDFPYYLFEEGYNASEKVICLPGYEFTYCYDLAAEKMLPRLRPAWLSEREGVDAQSGMPAGMQAEGPMIFGYAIDLGAYAYNVAASGSPKAVLPLAESGQGGTSLFVYDAGADKQQLVLAYLDMDTQQFKLKKLLDTPRSIDVAINKKAANNRYIILKERDAGGKISHIAVDMQQKSLIELPEDVSGQSVQDILKWLRRPK